MARWGCLCTGFFTVDTGGEAASLWSDTTGSCANPTFSSSVASRQVSLASLCSGFSPAGWCES